jgi:hypothetical protein
MYSVGCVMYKLIMKKVPFDTSNIFFVREIVSKGEYKKIPKKSEGGIYSDEIINITHSLMNLVLSIIIYFYYLL